MLPRVDLPELLLEVHGWTGCLDEFTHISGAGARIEDLSLSVAAVLVAEACNIGLRPVIKPGVPALTRDRLGHVDLSYVRAETIAAANARLIEAQAGIGLAASWGGGLVASVDGLRFVVPVATINAGPNPRYFGVRRGVTWLNAVNDQYAGLGAVVVPGTVRDSLYILDTLLSVNADYRPEMVVTDTAGYSDMVFGLFRLLGYQFSPRLADLSDTRFWRIDRQADYGPLNAVARSRVNLVKISEAWTDMLRVAGSLVTGTVRAYDLLRMMAHDGRPSALGQAFSEYGRIAKTMHLPVTWNLTERTRGPVLLVENGRSHCCQWRRSGRCWASTPRRPDGCACGPTPDSRRERSTRMAGVWRSTWRCATGRASTRSPRTVRMSPGMCMSSPSGPATKAPTWFRSTLEQG
jgi:TnpA family transposase